MPCPGTGGRWSSPPGAIAGGHRSCYAPAPFSHKSVSDRGGLGRRGLGQGGLGPGGLERGQGGDVGSGGAQGPLDRATLDGPAQARGIAVEIGTPTGRTPIGIHHDHETRRVQCEPDQLRLRRNLSATDTRSFRGHGVTLTLAGW